MIKLFIISYTKGRRIPLEILHLDPTLVQEQSLCSADDQIRLIGTRL